MALSEGEKARLTSHQRRVYELGRLSAEAVRMKGWLGKPQSKAKPRSKAKKADDEG